jgi:hypothetical protein
MDWEKTKEKEDKQGGVWTTYKNPDTDEKIITRESPNGGDTAIFKDGRKVNRKT